MWKKFARSPDLWSWLALLGLTAWGLYERQRDLVQMFDTVFGDEANTMACAMHNLPECSHIRLSEFWGHVVGTAWGGVPALYFFILAALFKFFGTSVHTSRMLEVTLGSLCIPLVYGLCRQLDMRRRAALLAAALFAASRWDLIATRIGWPNPMAAFTLALALFVALRAIQSRRPNWFVLSGLSIALCMNTYIAAHVVLLILPAWVVLLLLVHVVGPGVRCVIGRRAAATATIQTAVAPDEEQPVSARPEALAGRYRRRIFVAAALTLVALLVVAGVRLNGYRFFPWAAGVWLLAVIVIWPWLNHLAREPGPASNPDAANANSHRWRFSRVVSVGMIVALVTFVIVFSPWLYSVHRSVLDAHSGLPPPECREPGVNTQICLLRAELTRLELRAGTVFILSDFQRNVQWKSQHPDLPNDTFSILKRQTVTVLKMFNVEGDHNPLQNIPGYPMLDKLSGYLFAVGMLIMFWHWRRPSAQLMLVWFWLSLITSTILTENAPNANRAVVLLPALYIFIGAAINLVLAGVDALASWLRGRNTVSVRAALAVDVAIFLALCTAAIITTRVNLHDFFVVYASNRSAYGSYNPRDTHWSYLARDLRAESVVVYGTFAGEQHLALAPNADVLDATPRISNRDRTVCTAAQPPSHPDLIVVLNQEPPCYSESLSRDPANPLKSPSPQYYISEWESRFPGSKFHEAYNRYHELMFYWMAPK